MRRWSFQINYAINALRATDDNCNRIRALGVHCANTLYWHQWSSHTGSNNKQTHIHHMNYEIQINRCEVKSKIWREKNSKVFASLISLERGCL